MLDPALDGVNLLQPNQPNHMTEKTHFFGVRFQKKGIAQRTMNLQRQSRETRSGAHVEEISLARQKGRRNHGVKEKLDHHPLAVLQAGQIELPVPGPQLSQIDAKQIELLIGQVYSEVRSTLEKGMDLFAPCLRQ
jgi:hypothetical protein